MLKRFFDKIFGEPKIPSYEPRTDEYFYEDSVTKKQLEALRKIFDLIGGGGALSDPNWLADNLSDEDNAGSAFLKASVYELRPGDKEVAIYLDWKWTGDLVCSANQMFQEMGFQEHWEWAEHEGEGMFEALSDLQAWLAGRGYELLHVAIDGDDALVFPVKSPLSAEVRRLALRANLKLMPLRGYIDPRVK